MGLSNCLWGRFFTTSKFEPDQKGISLFTLIQTLQDLIRQVLSEPPQSLARWRTETIRAFDGDAAVLIDVIPELKLLLGPDFKVEPLASLGPVERESRFRDAFGRLLAICKLGILGSSGAGCGLLTTWCVCATVGRKGVVMFLDDLQWCSQSEFMLIANIAEEANRKMREWDGSSVDTPTGEPNSADGPPRNGMRQSNGPWDRGWQAVPLVHL